MQNKLLENSNIPKAILNLCKNFNIPVYFEPEWINQNFGLDHYEVSIYLLSSNIILSRISGVNSYKSGKCRLQLIEKIIKTHLPESKYIMLEDYTNFKSASKESKEYYINYQQHNKALISVLFYNLSSYMKLMVKIGKRIGKVNYPVEIFNSFDEAIKFAINLNNRTHDINIPQKVIQNFDNESDNSDIIQKPEWKNISFGDKKYSVSISHIKPNIVLFKSNGYSQINTIKPLINLFEQIVKEYIHPNVDVILLEDYSEFGGTSSEAKEYYINYFKNYSRLRAVIFFNTTKYFNLLIKLGKTTNQIKIPIEIAKNFNDALELAKKIDHDPTQINNSELEQNTILGINKLMNETKDEWKYYSEEYGFDFYKISDDIIFNTAFGVLKENNVDVFINTLERLIIESGFKSNKSYYRISDWSQMDRSNWNAKKIYSDKMEELNKKYPCKLFVVYGANPFMRMLIKIVNKTSKIPLITTDNLESALQIISKDRVKRIEVNTKQKWKKYSHSEISREINNFLNFMGDVNWDYSGMMNMDISDSELFSPLYESLILIKEDFDNILKQKDEAEIQLKNSKEDLEVRVHERTFELEQSNNKLLSEISERRKIEVDLLKAKEKAEIASKAKSNFLANMSHEIRTPLNGIIGMTELAIDTDLDETQQNLLSTVNFEAESLLNVINDILDFSKIEAGKMELETIKFNIKDLLDSFSTTFAFKAFQKGLEFLVYYSDKIPDTLFGDPTKLKQILANLSSNALKFTHQGEIFIKVDIDSISQDKIKLVFSVKDTGIGIPKEKQQQIFDSFTQVDSSTTRKYGGTGLGTTISKRFIQMMNGEIRLESEVDVGTTFLFTAEFDIEKETPIKMKHSLKILNNLQVLIVDDNSSNRFILNDYLINMNCKPIISDSAKNALELLNDEKNDIQLIISDYHMPNMDGVELSKIIREHKKHKDTPIIILSSVGSPYEIKDINEIVINKFINKPIRRKEFYDSILSVLNIDDNNDKMIDSSNSENTEIIEQRKSKKILLVEDYPTNQQIALRHLINAGYGVKLAENGKEALESFINYHFDVILMDIQMPVMDGYKATELIRKLELEKEIKKTPIIAMTAHAFKGYKEKCLDIGMDDYLTKPLRRQNLIKVVDQWIFDENIEQQVTQKTQSKTITIEKELPSIQLDIALEEFDNDKDFLNEVFSEFIETVDNQIIKIENSIKNNDFISIKKEAHSIKGGAANLTAKKLSSIAKELEEAGKICNLEQAIEQTNLLKDEFKFLKNIELD